MDFNCTLMDSAVLQRTAENVSEHRICGRCSADGDVLLTIRQNGRIFAGFSRRIIGRAAGGKFRGIIKGLPAGGPYTVEIRIGKEKAVFRHILVGDLWVLAGQSNMADSGYLPSLTPESPMVRGFYMDNHWDIARDPLHDVRRAAAEVHGGDPDNPQIKRTRGAGPGSPFGYAMYQATGIPQGLIACAQGGTTLLQWDPELKNMGDKSLYGAMYGRIQMLGGKISGVLWYQGEDEAGSDETAENYARKSSGFFAALRRDCQNPELPIVFAQLGAVIAPEAKRKELSRRFLIIRDAQYRLGLKIKNCICVPTIDLPLCDTLHLSTPAVTVLGKRMAQAMLSLRQKQNTPQISLQSASVTAEDGLAVLKLKFKGVQGKLTAPGEPCGFSITDMAGNFVMEAINITLDGDRAAMRTGLPYCKFQENYQIAYGGELNPHANITDEAGRPLPCLVQKIRIKREYSTDMLNCALVSDAVYGDDKLAALQLPDNWQDIPFHPVQLNNFYLPCPREDGEKNKLRKVYYYKFALNLPEAMKLRLLFGSDSSFALYCNGREIMRRYTANPVVRDEFIHPLTLEKGRHDFCCIFSSNSGNGWGICCRFTRTDGKILPEFVPTEKLN